MLTEDQINQFNEIGYLIIPNFFQVEELRNEAKQLLESFKSGKESTTKFTTSDDHHIGDAYFLESGDKIRFFMEEKSDESTPKEKAVNKIGHYLHELNPVFKKFSTQESIHSIARSLNFKQPAILQSMLIFKQPEIGAEIPGHIDSTFLYTEPTSAVGLWFALEDCTLENGCMWFAPGSHLKFPKCIKRFVRDMENGGTKMIYLDEDHIEPGVEEYVAAPVDKGSLVLIHGLVHHKSGINLSPKSRWIYTFHMIESGYPYPLDNWLQTTQPFTRLY
jgi:hypothetical protein